MLDLHQDKRILHGAEYVFWDDAVSVDHVYFLYKQRYRTTRPSI